MSSVETPAEEPEFPGQAEWVQGGGRPGDAHPGGGEPAGEAGGDHRLAMTSAWEAYGEPTP